MSQLFDLLGFVTELRAIDRDLEAMGPAIVERACKIVQAKAKSAIGKEHEEWPALAASTIADKQHQGYATPKPLLRSGELRDSIQFTVSGNEGCVGSDSEVALYQELGTSRIPPRSFLVSSAISSEDKIHRMAAAATVAALSGAGRNVGDIREVLHALHVVGHAVHEMWDEITEDDEAH